MNSHDMASAAGKSASSLGAGLAKLFMFVIATGLLLYGILSLLPARYEARAVLKFEGEGAQAALAEAMEAMRSRELISSFAREQQLARHADFNPAPGRQGPVYMCYDAGLQEDVARRRGKAADDLLGSDQVALHHAPGQLAVARPGGIKIWNVRFF